jgi:hypothetical protein
MAFFGSGYRIGLQDMQLLMDVCPLRVDSIFVRESHEDDFVVVPAAEAAGQCTTTEEQKPPSTHATHQSPAATGGTATLHCNKQVSAVLCISVLDVHQPVQITEAEVVRVRKRSRGLLLPPIFGGKNNSSGSSSHH